MLNKEAIEQLKIIKESLMNCGGCEGARQSLTCIYLAIKALENARKLHKWLDPDIDPELALEKIRELVYFGEVIEDETDN